MENMLARARAFAEPLIAGETLDTGENTLAHADAVAAIRQVHGRLRGHAGRQLPGLCLPAPEPSRRK
jgi:GTP pyrophosphokinase